MAILIVAVFSSRLSRYIRAAVKARMWAAAIIKVEITAD
jgi:hypothetical protein